MKTSKVWKLLAAGWLGWGVAMAAAAPQPETHAIMHPDLATMKTWMAAYRNAPRARTDAALARKLTSSLSLLSHLQYTPSERNQSSCGDCWQWAGTGVIEIGLDVQRSIKDRLSVQFIANCHNNPNDDCGCKGGWLSDVANFYASKRYAIPWSNTNAYFQNGDGTCHGTCGAIGATPNYPITAITNVTIDTYGVDQSTAIANIKNVLGQNRAIWFGFFFATSSDWSNFHSFWNNKTENVRWENDYGGHTWDSGGGGHAVLIVGYDDTDPTNKYWLIVNSWGTASGNRPSGLFRWKMDMNYDTVTSYRGENVQSFYFQTLDLNFGNQATPTVTTRPASGVGTTSATINGSINPNGSASTYRFEYGKTTAYGTSTPAVGAGSDSAVHAVSNTLSGLEALNTYHFRIVGSNTAGASYGVDQSFSTSGGAPLAPTATTEAATSVGANAATLNGTVNPRGTSTAYFFQYGPSADYSLETAHQDAGAGTSVRAVSNTVTGLADYTLYHYRLVASNSVGKVYGADRTLTTLGSSGVLLSEGFEGGDLPAGWSNVNYSGPEVPWTFRNGGNWAGCPDGPHSGNYNAFFYAESYLEPWTSLITPPLQFSSGATNATLTFWHYQGMDEWWYDQDELLVYVMSPVTTNYWKLIAHYTENVPLWTKRTISLPYLSTNYYISFDGISYWGYGIGIDDVLVTAAGAPPPAVAEMKRVPGRMVLCWGSEDGVTYKVEYTASLKTPVAWTPESGSIVPVNGVACYSNNIWGGPTSRYFRIRKNIP